MSYERNETEQDRENERAVMAVFMAKYDAEKKFNYKKLNENMYSLDFGVYHYSNIRCFVEIKCHPRAHYMKHPTCNVSLFKVLKARLLSELTGKFCFFVVRFNCGTHAWTNMASHVPGDVVWGGRTDRGFEFDEEPMATFPWKNFTKLPVPATVETV